MKFDEILEKYRADAASNRDLGDKFEKLMKGFLLTSQDFRGEGIEKVWLWSEFPSRKDFGGGQDVGIDLVARDPEGSFYAVQCKCYGSAVAVTKDDVDTFLSTSSREFSDTEDAGRRVRFSRRIWFDTSGQGLTRNAEDAMKSQSIPVTRYSLEALRNASVDWEKLDEGICGEEAATPKHKALPHQEEAIEKASEYFLSHDRGKLIMACGTGKTFTSLRIAESETEGKPHPTVLFLSPSIALVGQTLKEWNAQARKPIHGICICSDPTASKTRRRDADSVEESVIDLALPATTDKDEAERQLGKARAGQEKDGGLVVVFSTYQSIAVVSSVQKALGDRLLFDLCISDEAHRTTGYKAKGDEDESAFVKVHDPEFIRARKRLYMTATPRLYAASAKKRAEEIEATLWSMDDEKIYGGEIYRLGFGKAVSLGLLSDYKVLVLALSEDKMSRELQDSISEASSECGEEIPVDDRLKAIGCINDLSKITREEGMLTKTDPGIMHTAIAFSENIAASKRNAANFAACSKAYMKTLSAEERERVARVEAEHIDGTMNAARRGELLSWLKDAEKEGGRCRILSNVRCLSEGVDVPSLDAVIFLSPRNSQVDVVQSVGRVMRKAPGKKYGYIIIPVVIPSGKTPEEALGDSKRFAVVWDVLQALRAHDERFDAMINQIELNKNKPRNIHIDGFPHFGPFGGGDDSISEPPIDFPSGPIQGTLGFEEVQGAIYAKMVEKVGSKRYWEQWAQDVASIAERHIDQIERLIAVEDSEASSAFRAYWEGLRKNINPSVTKRDAVEMLAQHFITKPIFDALFYGYSFAESNAVSISLQGMTRILSEQTPKEDGEKLERFYESVRARTKGIDNSEGRQKIITELYEKFFKTAFPKTVEKLGIVYTPIPVVDFIIRSVEDVLKSEFGRSMSDENVHILDPFTGTGTFVVRLLQSGIIKPEDLGRKYKSELHACEIVLLAYYIASVNIENAYHDIKRDNGGDGSYEPFEGIVLTDTFQMTETNDYLIDTVFPQNSEKVNELRKTPLTVIIGNPPYSVGQRSANDNNANEAYPILDGRVEATYSKASSATNKNALYDSYIKAFRWATDQLYEKDERGAISSVSRDGVIGFVTNAGWLDGNAMDGMRKCLENEFASIYVFNLRGNCRTQGELRRKEAGNIFGLGSRTPVAITILVKKKGYKGKAKIHYLAVDDYLKREEKFELCREYGSALSPSFKSSVIHPNEHGDWLKKRNDKFSEFIELGDNKDKSKANTFFVPCYSNGLKTGRDAYCINYSKEKLVGLVEKQIEFFNSESERLSSEHQQEVSEADIIRLVSRNPLIFSWDEETMKRLRRSETLEMHEGGFREEA